MKRITIYLAAAMAVTLFTKCIDDTGNYTYKPAGEVTPAILSQLAANYTAIMLEPLVIDPEIGGDEADYEYCWCAYSHTSTTINRRDTLSREKKLDYNMALAPGQYKLIFQARDKKTGVSAYQRTIVTVSSRFSSGYFINKYENGRTDVDFIDGSGTLRPNILKTINGDDLPGRPIRSTLSDQYCYQVVNEDGTKTAKTLVSTFMICTDEDMRIYNGNQMTLMRDWDHAFMETPAVKKPQGVWGTGGGFMMLNDGRLHVVAYNTSSEGQFGYAYPDEGLKLTGMGAAVVSNMMFFNENTGAIVGYHNSQNRFAYTRAYAATAQHHFTNQECLYMGTQHNYLTSAARGWALLKSKNAGEAGKLRLVDVMVGSFNQVSEVAYYGSYEIPAEFAAGVGSGKVFCVRNGGGTVASAIQSILYYSAGDNKVHYYNQNNQTHKSDVVVIPADEQIVYIHHNYDWACNNHATYLHADAPNEFLVLSNKGGNWTLRIYPMEGQTQDVKTANGPKATYTGAGQATNLIFREPHTSRTW